MTRLLSLMARHYRRAKAVDDPLDHNVAHRDKALLQNTGHRYLGKLAQEVPGEELGSGLGLDPAKTEEHHRHRQNTAYPLAQKGGPGHAVHPHAQARHKQDVHADIAHRGAGQKEKGGFGVSQGGEDAGGDVVVKDKGQAQDVDV